jgi:hypothetical protein
MGFKAKPGKSFSPPSGMYQLGGARPSRFTGTDIDGEVYSIAHSNYSDREKYRIGYDNIKWDKKEEGG